MKTPTVKEKIAEIKEYFNSPRFKGIKRLYSARMVAEQQGTIFNDYSIAKEAASAFYQRLEELYQNRTQITTFGPYSPSQAVMMKRAGIEGIYLGGWATSAKGSMDEDPGADLASYPLSQVPNEAAGIVRALLTADRNQFYMRNNLPREQQANQQEFDFRPFIIADADTGHGGDAAVRNLIRRFVEVGVPGYHIEDQKPGTKKCGHQGGKVLVSVDEQIKRLNAARFQLDIMRVPGLIVARTDAEAATLIENISDERDHPFVLGATSLDVPSYKAAFIALHKLISDHGVQEIYGHELYKLSEAELASAGLWLVKQGFDELVLKKLPNLNDEEAASFEGAYAELLSELVTVWENEAGVKTLGDAIADLIRQHEEEGAEYAMSVEEWQQFASRASITEATQKAHDMGIEFVWDVDLTRTPEGFFQIKGGIPYAISKSLAVAPYADLLWMETKTADLEDAKIFADAIHAVYPDKMLVYNLSPSFNWDSTGMTEAEMTEFSRELGKMGFVFNFITYGGHQIDGLAADEFAQSLQQDGMLALARVQRKFRLLESPYKKPQTHVGGPRLDGALTASSARTATTKAMGKGSTEVQHAIQTELPVSLLQNWLDHWADSYELTECFDVKLKPHVPGSHILELSLFKGEEKAANVVFTAVTDRNKSRILSIRDQNTFDDNLRRKRLMALMQVFLMNRYKVDSVHYLTPTDDNYWQTAAMRKMGLFKKVNNEIGQLIVAEVDIPMVRSFVEDPKVVSGLIERKPVEV